MRIKITKKAHSYTFTIECELNETQAAIRHLEEMAEKIPNAMSDSGKPSRMVLAPSLVETRGLTHAVETLLNSAWADPPPNMMDIEQVMKAQGRKISKTSLSSILIHLIRAGRIGRKKEAGVYVYFGLKSEGHGIKNSSLGEN